MFWPMDLGKTQLSESCMLTTNLRMSPTGVQPDPALDPISPGLSLAKLNGQSPRPHFCGLLSSNDPAPRRQAWAKADSGRRESLVSGCMNPQLARRAPSRPLPSPLRLVSSRPHHCSAQRGALKQAVMDGGAGSILVCSPVLQTFLQQINCLEWPPPQQPARGALLKGRR